MRPQFMILSADQLRSLFSIAGSIEMKYFVRSRITTNASVAQLDARPGGCGFDPRRVGNILSLRFDHEISSVVILSLPLIQEGQLSVFLRKNVHNTG